MLNLTIGTSSDLFDVAEDEARTCGSNKGSCVERGVDTGEGEGREEPGKQGECDGDRNLV